MDEYLTEHEQWERLKKLLRTYGPWIVLGVTLGAVGLGIYRWWHAHLENEALAAASQYRAMLAAFDENDRTKGFALMDELKREHPKSPYVDQANLIAARLHVENNELDKAVERLREVVDNSRDKNLALIARTRLARVQISLGKPDDALATLKVANEGAFAARFQEIRGDAYLAKGDEAAALREYRAARSSASGRQLVNTELLDLKINDLQASEPEPQEPATASAGQ